MGNMSYCRFQNTLEDLRDCQDNFDSEDLSEEETRARASMLRICQQIASDYGDDED